MKHAGETALDNLETLLNRLREIDALNEKKRGIFYRKSKAFIHFHEDPAGLFADVRLGGSWQRLPVNTAAEKRHLLALVSEEVAA